MSCTGEYNFCVVAGDTLEFVIRYKADGEYVDITGYTTRMQLRTRVTDEDAVIEATCTITDALKGEVSCVLTPEQTVLLVAPPKAKSRYFYDVEFTNPMGKVLTIVSGSIEINLGVTR